MIRKDPASPGTEKSAEVPPGARECQKKFEYVSAQLLGLRLASLPLSSTYKDWEFLQKQFVQSLRTKWGHKVAQAAVVARVKESSA